jgi:hypothetical protein
VHYDVSKTALPKPGGASVVEPTKDVQQVANAVVSQSTRACKVLAASLQVCHNRA